MCTVVIHVPETADEEVRLLAVRDEDPSRLWDPPGYWWPELPGVVGVRDRLAGGAWLAANPGEGRLAVVLNRADVFSGGLPAGPNGLASRGSLVLEAAVGSAVPEVPRTAGFNLVEVAGGVATVTSWDGATLTRTVLAPGVHMVAHDDVDDPRTARIEAWLPAFRAAAEAGGSSEVDWRRRWLDVLEGTAALPVDDDRAIIRDNRSDGYPTLSLLVCLAEIRPGIAGGDERVRLSSATLDEPAVWEHPDFQTAT
ncbi:NRDE family protein [Aestuariimicrobium soli]|uniref:NRDE family protein n=1 Tax=Aestuariimicrobium soli TaxID=2035834 RepID=UPI003EBB7B57